jgi:hypothetical protein
MPALNRFVSRSLASWQHAKGWGIGTASGQTYAQLRLSWNNRGFGLPFNIRGDGDRGGWD